MTIQRISLKSAAPQGWKNGGGLTRELLAFPSAAGWQVRISVAEVTADGPFSRFEGVQRWFAVLQGAGVRLQVDGQTTDLRTPDAAFAFDGAANTHCTLLGGPTQDFNLMLRGAQGSLQRVNSRWEVLANATDLIALYDLSMLASACFGSEKCFLEPGELLWTVLTAPTKVSVLSSDALCMHIRFDASPNASKETSV